MNIKNNIINYLYDRDYIVCLYDNCVYIFNYAHLDLFNDTKIVVSLKNKVITLKGNNMLIGRITKEELLIKGDISGIEVQNNDE